MHTNTIQCLIMNASQQPIFTANALNQKLGKIWFPDPIHWNSKSLKWEFQEKYLLPFFIGTMGAMTYNACICSFTLYYGISHPEFISKVRLAIIAMTLSLCITMTTLTISNCIYGREILAIMNWSHSKVGRIDNLDAERVQKLVYRFATGLIIFIILVTQVFTAIALYANLDPYYYALEYLKLEKNHRLLLNILRYLMVFHSTNIAVISFRTFCVAGFVAGFYRVEILNSMVVNRPTKSLSNLYKECCIVMQIMRPFESKVFTVALGGLFAIILLFTNGLIVITYFGKYLLVCPIVVTLLFVMFMLHIIFLLSCQIFQMSEEVRSRWRGKTAEMRDRWNRKYAFKVIKGLPKIAIPAGYVGIMDKDTKTNYLENLIGSVVDSSVARKGIFK